MNEAQLEDLKFPIGRFVPKENYSLEEVNDFKDIIARFPTEVEGETSTLSTEQLLTPYRPEGWHSAQVVHHCADSHMNAYIRFKLALTEDVPTIKPYKQSAWAELVDGNGADIKDSLAILHGVHNKWTMLISSLAPSDLEKVFYHPELKQNFPLDKAMALYAWHCSHHLGHIVHLKNRMNWG